MIFHPELSKSTVPVLYLLHGWGGSSSDWSEHVDLKSYANKYNFIIVCLEGFYDSWYANSPFIKNSQVETFFWQSIVPVIEKKYEKNINHAAVFITGLSMGGHGALNLFMKKPDYFLSAGSMSGIVDITKFSKLWGISKVLGEYETNKKLWDSYSAVSCLDSKKLSGKEIILECGLQDFAYTVNKDFKNKADKLGVKVNFIERPGRHDWVFWTKALENQCDFFSKKYEALIKRK